MGREVGAFERGVGAEFEKEEAAFESALYNAETGGTKWKGGK